MSNVIEIESAVTRLSEQELAEFRAWFDQFEADQWDAQIEKDAKTGKFDILAKQALADFKTGNVREL